MCKIARHWCGLWTGVLDVRLQSLCALVNIAFLRLESLSMTMNKQWSEGSEENIFAISLSSVR